MAQPLRKPEPPQTLDAASLFQQRLASAATDTEALLKELLSATPETGETKRPQRLLEAMRYGTLNGGKRFRPFLITETAALFGVPRERALMAAAALECVHCYSLIHDDLPAMDNDELRRGRPTAHVAFDEATAILAGDGLLTFAFDVLSRPQTHPDAAVRIELISALARGAGLGGMAGGQMLDLAAEGRFSNHVRQAENHHDVQTLQAMKTGALIRFGCRAGAILGQADSRQLNALDRYGTAIGEAFQIADDLLDMFGDPTEVGKQTGKDEAAHKATFISVLGTDGAKQQLAALVAEAETAVAPFGATADILRTAARFVAERHS